MAKKEFTFDWTIFKNRGFEFQDMCADIFKFYKYDVRVLSKGGSDEGRDIELYTYGTKNLVVESKKPWAWVECKSRVSGNGGLKLDDVKSNIFYAFNEHISYLIFMTNHKFGNEAHHLFNKYNENPRSFISIRRIEKEELEDILVATPEIYCKYFDPAGKPEDYASIEQYLRLDSTITPNSKFVDDFEGYRIDLKSRTFQETKLEIEYDATEVIDVHLAPLEEKSIFIKAASADNFDLSKLKFNSKQANIIVKSETTTPLIFKIDHIFVDPFDIKKQIVDSLRDYNNIYLTAGAGKGKSRLLKELRRSIDGTTLAIDVSLDYNKSFFDHLLDKLLGVEKEYLAILPEHIITTYLADKAINQDYLSVFVSYLKGMPEVNYDILITTIEELFSTAYRQSTIIIDNIHNFSLHDFKLFKTLLDSNKDNKFIFSARNEEITEGNLKLYLSELKDSSGFLKFDLQELSLEDIIIAFIQKTSADENTKIFLRKYQSASNFQQFILILKHLKTTGVLSQLEGGKIIIHQSNSLSQKVSTYFEVYHDLITALKTKVANDDIENMLNIAAVFGYCFPIDLVSDTPEATRLLDLLITHELLMVDEVNPAFLRFDHELTREILHNSIPHIQKLGLHKAVIKYLESIDEANPAFSPRQLSLHYNAINNYSRAAYFSNKEAHRLLKKSEIVDARDYFNRTLTFIDSSDRQNSQENFPIEADSLDQIISIDFVLSQNDDVYNMIRSLHVLTHLMDDDIYEGKAYYYFSKYYLSKKKDVQKSLAYIDKALAFFKNRDIIEYAKTLNLNGLIFKRIERFEEAEQVHRAAIDILLRTKTWDVLSEAYADLGAVFLEDGKGHLAIDWWHQSLVTAKKTGNLTCICERLIDYSYLLALYKKTDITVINEMESALFMARRLKIVSDVCRALVNYSNYLFATGKEPALIKSFIDEAITIGRAADFNYLLLLGLFSYDNFRNAHPEVFELDFTGEIKRMVVDRYRKSQEKASLSPDTRIINILKFFIIREDPDILRAIESIDNAKLQQFSNEINKKGLIGTEGDNPYYFNNGYLTYY